MTIDEIWADDRLDRRQDAEFLYRFLTGQVEKRKKLGKPATYVLNVDAGWGGGKSFFLERFERQLALDNHVVASINAWRDDHADDPYIAIMAAIDKAFAPYVKKEPKLQKAWSAVKANGGRLAVKAAGGALKVLAKRHLDVSPDDVFEAGDDASLLEETAEIVVEQALDVGNKEIEKIFDGALEKLIHQFQKTEQAMRSFRDRLAAAIRAIPTTGKAGPLFILVDELDRCRPTYAIQLLERMKHLFEVEGVVFVFATNASQLQHSVAGAYGPAFDGFMYLKRFFDSTYAFGSPHAKVFVSDLCANLDSSKIHVPQNDLVQFVDAGRVRFDIDLRSLQQILDLIDAVISAWSHRARIEIVLLFPLCVAFHRTGRANWDEIDTQALDGWILGPPPTEDRFRGRSDRTINVLQAFHGARRVIGSMQAILDLSQIENADPTARYVNDGFEAEWVNQAIDRNKPSIQHGLLQLVMNAGRLERQGSSPTSAA